jgi:uncharacterized protein involved in exopolysaccharide biosynthesis
MNVDINYWIELIFRRRRTVIEVGGIVFGLVVLGTLLWPPVYQATSKILVQDNRAQLLVSPGLQQDTPQNPAAIANPINEQDLNSEMELLTSTYLIRHAIANLPTPARYKGPAAEVMSAVGFVLGLPDAGYRAFHDSPQLDAHEAWALDLSHHLSAAVIKKSNIIEVTFRAHDPQWSQKFVSLLIAAYLDYHARISHDPAAQEFFQKQAKLLQAKLEANEEQLRQFQVQSGITSVDDQKKALVDQLSQLEMQFDKASADYASAEQQSAYLAQLLNKTPEHLPNETRQVQNNALAELKPQVLQLKAERAELLTRYQPDSERIKEIDAKLSAAQRILDSEDRLEVQEKSVTLNPVWVTVDSNLGQTKGLAASLQASRQSLTQQITATKQQLTQMVNNALVLDRLQRAVQNSKDAYLSYVRKSEEARAAEALNSSRILNVSVAQPATTPLRPVFPNVPINIAAGLLLGMVFGVAAAYREEENDPKIYSSATIAEVAGIDTVAVLRDEF